MHGGIRDISKVCCSRFVASGRRPACVGDYWRNKEDWAKGDRRNRVSIRRDIRYKAATEHQAIAQEMCEISVCFVGS